MINNINSNPQTPAFSANVKRLPMGFYKKSFNEEIKAVNRFVYTAESDRKLCTVKLKRKWLFERENDGVANKWTLTPNNIQMKVKGAGKKVQMLLSQEEIQQIRKDTPETNLLENAIFTKLMKLYGKATQQIEEAFHNRK